MKTQVHPHLLTENYKRFLFGGRAVFTVVSGKDGTRYTYRIDRVPRHAGEDEEEEELPDCNCENGKYNGKTCIICKGTGKKQPVFFINLLTGPDNTRSYTYMGIAKWDARIREETVITTKNSKINGVPLSVARWLIWLSINDETLPEGYQLWHEGFCARCGKPLTVPASIELGWGPICWERL